MAATDVQFKPQEQNDAWGICLDQNTNEGEHQFCIKWRDFDAAENTWEPSAQNCQEATEKDWLHVVHEVEDRSKFVGAVLWPHDMIYLPVLPRSPHGTVSRSTWANVEAKPDTSTTSAKTFQRMSRREPAQHWNPPGVLGRLAAHHVLCTL